MSTKIAITNLVKSFNGNLVLNNVTLNIQEGDSYVIIGGSGTGKSVLLKTIIGLMQADSGSIKINNEETIKLKEQARQELMRKFGVLFQGGALFDSLPVWQNITFGLNRAQKLSVKEAKELAVDKLKLVGLLPQVANLYPAELSGGMQKRVGFARAIAADPEILFFDEPTTGLDPIMSNVISNLILDTHHSNNKKTSITISHDINSVRKIGTRVGLLYKGNLLWEGKVDELDSSSNPHLQQFIQGRTDGPIQFD